MIHETENIGLWRIKVFKGNTRELMFFQNVAVTRDSIPLCRVGNT